MYYAIVFLPLLGALIAALTALTGARARFPGGPPDAVGASHAHGPVDESPLHVAPSASDTHAALEPSHSEPHPQQEPAAGSRPAELVTTVFLFASMLLSWFAFADVGFGHHETRAVLFPWMSSGDLKMHCAPRVCTPTAVMLPG